MQRIPEPELMDEPAQAQAYAAADFQAAHNEIISHFARVFPHYKPTGPVVDLGCGPADITVRFAQRYPECRIDAVDGAESMLEHGRMRVELEGLQQRVSFHRCVLPHDPLPRSAYQTILSNSLLHHLHDPAVLWGTVKRLAIPNAYVFIADLRRPKSREQAIELVNTYAEGEAEILKRDFYNSLLAAFTPQEVATQLQQASLNSLTVNAITDRHFIVYGRL